MSDLISRQDAFYAVNKAFDGETLLDGLIQSIAVRAIRDVPSAEPETHEERTETHSCVCERMETHACVSPCDVCRHYPPSSADGKPCSMCPAEPTEQVRTYMSLADCVSRQAAIDAVCSVCGDTECNIFDPDNKAKLYCPEPYAIMKLPSAEPEIIHCRDCEYGEIDQDNWWFCTNLGCQIGEPDGSGFCADAEKRR